MLEAIFELLVPLVMASIIDVGIANRDRDYVIHMCLLLTLFAILGLAFAITAQYFAAKAAIYTASKMRAASFSPHHGYVSGKPWQCGNIGTYNTYHIGYQPDTEWYQYVPASFPALSVYRVWCDDHGTDR